MKMQLTRRALLRASAVAGACTAVGAVVDPFSPEASAVADVVGTAASGPDTAPGVFALASRGSGLVGVVVDTAGTSLRAFAPAGGDVFVAEQTLCRLPDSLIPAGLVAADGAVVVYGAESYVRSTVEFARGTAAAAAHAPFATGALQLAPSRETATVTGIRPVAYAWTAETPTVREIPVRFDADRAGMLLSADPTVSSVVVALAGQSESFAGARAVRAARGADGQLVLGADLGALGEEAELAVPAGRTSGFFFSQSGEGEGRRVTPVADGKSPRTQESRPGNIVATAASARSSAVLVDTGQGLRSWQPETGWRPMPPGLIGSGEDVVGIYQAAGEPAWGVVRGTQRVRVLPTVGKRG